MFPYIIAFIITLLLVRKDAQKSNNFIYYVLAPLPLLLLVAFRDISVGTDTEEYADIYKWASNSRSLIEFLGSTRIEPLYASITYAISIIGRPIQYLFFVCAVLSVYPIFVGARMLRNEVSETFVIFLYCMLFYNYSMNIARQAIAMSFLFLAFICLLNQKNIKAYILVIIAVLFHYIAVVCIPLMLLYQFSGNISKCKLIGFITICLGVVYLLFPILNLEAVMNQYESNYLSADRGGMQTSYTIEILINCIIVFSYAKRMRDKQKIFLFKTGILYVFTLNILSILASQAFRLALYMDIFSLLYISELLANKIYSRGVKKVKLAYIFFAIIFWVFVFVFNQSGDTIPYCSSVLSL